MVSIDSSKYQTSSGHASFMSFVSEIQPLFANDGLAGLYQLVSFGSIFSLSCWLKILHPVWPSPRELEEFFV